MVLQIARQVVRTAGSSGLRRGSGDLYSQLRGITSDRAIGFGDNKVLSVPIRISPNKIVTAPCRDSIPLPFRLPAPARV